MQGKVPFAYKNDKSMLDLKKKYVRVRGVKHNKYIEFDFSIGDPELFVELVLPFKMFETFCSKNEVEHLPAEKDVHNEYERMTWRTGESRKIVFKN